jgi:hypothetical protein
VLYAEAWGCAEPSFSEPFALRRTGVTYSGKDGGSCYQLQNRNNLLNVLWLRPTQGLCCGSARVNPLFRSVVAFAVGQGMLA